MSRRARRTFSPPVCRRRPGRSVVPLLALTAILLLLPFGTLAQSTASDASAPLQTLIDAVPRVVERAIHEAEFDGTPDEADAIVAQMVRYVTGFEDGSHWPDDAEASRLPMEELLRYATGLADLTSQIPSRVAAVEQTRAACAAWHEDATTEDVIAWAFEARPAAIHLKGVTDGLEAMAQDVPVAVDLGPLERAVIRLDRWLMDEVVDTNVCLDAVADRLGVALGDDHLTLHVSPQRIWPHGTITIVGGSLAPDVDARVHITSEGLGLDVTRTLSARGSYFLRYTIPAETVLDTHTITVRGPGNETSATIEVGQIPVRIHMMGPDAVPIGEDFSVRFYVRSAVSGLPVPGLFVVEGALQGEALASESLRIDATAPLEPTRLVGTVNYAGDALFRSSGRSYEIRVYDPDRVGAEGGGMQGFDIQPPAPPPIPEVETLPEGGAQRAWDDWLVGDGLTGTFTFPIFDWEVPVWVALILAALAVFLAWEGVLYLRAWRAGRNATTPAVAVAFDAAHRPIRSGLADPTQRTSKTFGALFVELHRWALRLHIVRPSETAREFTRRYARGNPALVRSVVDFERIRYGGHRDDAHRSPGLTQRLVVAWRGIVDRMRR